MVGSAPINDPKKRSSFASLLGDAAGISDSADTKVDIITFAEAPWGLGMGSIPGVPRLLPAQRFILKAYYGLELDNTDNYIPIYDTFNENLLYQFTEVEFHNYLLDEGRISPGALDGSRTTLALICGRRGTKTTVTAIIANYEAYCVLLQTHPQRYFGIMPDDHISMTCLSTSEEQAKILYDRVAGNLSRATFFKDFMLKSPNLTEFFLKSQRDIDEFEADKYTIEFVAEACSARGNRGRNNVLVAFDEVAHFFKELGRKASSDKSDKAVYEAVVPSLALYRNPDGTPAGKIILISSPAEKAGLLWDEYERSFDLERGTDILMIQLPSWEMNPTIPSAFLRAQYNKNPIVFLTEYGSQFSDRLKGWIDDPSIVRGCTKEGLKIVPKSSRATPHFMGIDIGLKNDGTAIAVTHVEMEKIENVDIPMIVLDWYAVRYASKEKVFDETSGQEVAFEPSEMVDWIESVAGNFNITAGLMDQHYAMAIVPDLRRRRLGQIESRHFNDTRNSEIYQNLMAKFMTRGLRLPESDKYDERGKIEDSELVAELLKLQAIQKSKYIIKVFIPEGRDRHDDLSDALARSVKLATEYIEGGGKGTPPTAARRRMGAVGVRARNMRKMELNRPTRGIIYRSGGNRYGGGSGPMGPMGSF